MSQFRLQDFYFFGESFMKLCQKCSNMYMYMCMYVSDKHAGNEFVFVDVVVLRLPRLAY